MILRPTTLNAWISRQEPTEQSAAMYDRCKPMDTDRPLRIEVTVNKSKIEYKAYREGFYADGNDQLWVGFRFRHNGTLFKRPADTIKFVKYEKDRRAQNV